MREWIKAGLVLTAYLAPSVAVLACAGDATSGAADQGEPRVEYEERGDTLVVRTVSGSAWEGPARLVPDLSIGVLDGAEEYMFGRIRSIAVGSGGEIYVVDSQVPALRVYEPDGTYRTTFGREGGGPGEYAGPDAGLAVLSDGRIALRDPGNARIMVYTPTGEEADVWPIRGGFSWSQAMFKTWEDILHVGLLLDPEADIGEWVMGLSQILPDGSPGDTLVPPDPELDTPRLIASRDGSTSVNTIPFWPDLEWTLHPRGHFVWGVNDEYAILSTTPDGRPLRIERSVDRVPVSDGEKAVRRDRTTQDLRTTDPNWRWDGPDIPDRKPYFTDIRTSEEGQIWVRLHQPGREVDNPDYDPDVPFSTPSTFVEPLVFDVFGEDGTYLGQVHGPDDLWFGVNPVIRNGMLWGVTRDAFGVQRVVRYRVQGS